MHIPTTSEVIAKLKAGERPPAGAMRVFGSPVELAAEGNSPDAKTIKVKLKARARQAIHHPWWGTVWHDLSTMRSRSKIALDDTHDIEIGYGRPVQSEYGLEVEGVVVTNPDNPQHPSNRIAYNLKNGIPQEASIDFSGDYDVMELPEGMTTTVNGIEATGPCLVVQNWPLRACAICKEGADSTTNTEMLSGGNSLLPRNITTFSQPKETAVMPETISAPAAVVEAPAETPAAQPTTLTEGAQAPVEVTPVETTETNDHAERLQSVSVELERVNTQLEEANEENLVLMAEIAQLEERIEALTKGVPAIPPTPASEGPVTWSQALKLVKSEHPHMAEWQLQEECTKRFPALLAKINKQ